MNFSIPTTLPSPATPTVIPHSDSRSDFSPYVTSYVQYTTYKIIACIECATMLRANITHVTREYKQAHTLGGFGGFRQTAHSLVEVRRGCMRLAWRVATLHGCSKRSGCGRVQVGPITFSQTKHADELVEPSPKTAAHHRANIIILDVWPFFLGRSPCYLLKVRI